MTKKCARHRGRLLDCTNFDQRAHPHTYHLGKIRLDIGVIIVYNLSIRRIIMSHGLKILAKDGTTVRLDTSSVTKTIIDSFTVAEGTAGSITKTYSSIASDMDISVTLLQISTVSTYNKQLIPTVTINQAAKSVTVTGSTATTTTQEGYTRSILSVECRVIVLGE